MRFSTVLYTNWSVYNVAYYPSDYHSVDYAMNPDLPPNTDSDKVAPVRQRLSPGERIPQLLEAALFEFSAHGFQKARVDDIAARAGLSKGGFYAYFDSKDEVFEALLREHLSRLSPDLVTLADGAKDTRDLARRLIERLCVRASDQTALAVLQLLLADGRRLPVMVDAWAARVMEQIEGDLVQLLQRCVELGLCRRSVLCRKPWLIIAPVIYAMTVQLVPGAQKRIDIDVVKNDLLELLLELLEPRD